MPDLWMDVDTALSEVPVNIMPLIDNTDFKTIEDAVAYNAAGMALYWHFVTTGGAYTLTAVTPTTGGNYDWTDQGAAGIYTIEIPASGGASINNDTEGFGWFTGVCTGVLPWRGPTIGFRAAALNNSLIDGTTIDVNVTAMAANVVTASAVADGAIDAGAIAADAITAAKIATGAIDADALAADAVTEIQNGLATPTNITAGTITTVTNLTNNNDKTGYTLSSAGIQAIWDALTSALTTIGSIGKLLVDNINATISSRASQTSLDILEDFVDTEVAAIKAKTDNLPASPANETTVSAVKTKTDSLTFTVAGQVDANVQSINDAALTGDGSGTPWGPA